MAYSGFLPESQIGSIQQLFLSSHCAQGRERGVMSKSDDTKERIARTFLECMETTPYGKINVSQLCERAHISRKTFYYHFEDKERLVRWICIQDLIEWAHSDTSDGPSSYVSLISFFIEKNRILYGHALLDMTPGSFGQLLAPQRSRARCRGAGTLPLSGGSRQQPDHRPLAQQAKDGERASAAPRVADRSRP